jgi:hypothetical protein
MARNRKTIIEKLMPGYRVAEEMPRARGIDSKADDGPPAADVRGPDFAKLQEKYLGVSNVARSRSIGQTSAASNTSKLVTVEKQSLLDVPAVGRKTVVFDEDDDKIVGKQG